MSVPLEGWILRGGIIHKRNSIFSSLFVINVHPLVGKKQTKLSLTFMLNKNYVASPSVIVEPTLNRQSLPVLNVSGSCSKLNLKRKKPKVHHQKLALKNANCYTRTFAISLTSKIMATFAFRSSYRRVGKGMSELFFNQ